MDTLQFIWFILLFILFIGYAILDGFDLGIGVITLFTRRQEDRDTLIRQVTPCWDGHEAWLVMAGCVLYMSFPPVYTVLYNAFGLPLSGVLLALALKAVAVQIRPRITQRWQHPLDLCFGLCSTILAFLPGVFLATILRGLPLSHSGAYEGSLALMIHPYCLLGGALSLTTFTLYGSAFGAIRTQGDLQNAMRQWMSRLWGLMVILWICLTAYSLFEAQYLFKAVLRNAVFDGLFVLFLISIIVITISCNAQKDTHAFLACAVVVTCMLGMAGACLFPCMIPSTPNLEHSLTLDKACAPTKALKIALTATLTGMPLIMLYHWIVYRFFRIQTTAKEGYLNRRPD